jgi:hypothetical protein
VYLSIRSNLHGGFHEKNIQFHQWTWNSTFDRYVITMVWINLPMRSFIIHDNGNICSQ